MPTEYARSDTEINVNIDDSTLIETVVIDDGQVYVDVSEIYGSAGGHEYYRGDYEVTPSTETQVLQTQDMLMGENVVVHPIPSNYGLITWNGAVLTVS